MTKNKTSQPKSSQNKTTELKEIVIEGDLFKIKTNDIFSEKDVYELDLPKFILKNSIKNIYNINEKSSITIFFIADHTNPDISKRLYKAIKEGIKEFKIYFPNAKGEVGSMWEFSGVKIKAMDFGSLKKVRDEIRTIQCELEYEFLSIDNETIT